MKEQLEWLRKFVAADDTLYKYSIQTEKLINSTINLDNFPVENEATSVLDSPKNCILDPMRQPVEEKALWQTSSTTNQTILNEDMDTNFYLEEFPDEMFHEIPDLSSGLLYCLFQSSWTAAWAQSCRQ